LAFGDITKNIKKKVQVNENLQSQPKLIKPLNRLWLIEKNLNVISETINKLITHIENWKNETNSKTGLEEWNQHQNQKLLDFWITNHTYSFFSSHHKFLPLFCHKGQRNRNHKIKEMASMMQDAIMQQHCEYSP
jgi:ribosomal protein S15P/S13E